MISGAPIGAILSDRHGDSVTITSVGQQVNVLGWKLSSLEITPPNDAGISLTATASETDAAGKTSTASATKTISVTPEAPALAPASVSGTEGSAILLNLGVTVKNLPGDSNSLSSLVVSVIPVGAKLSDGTHNFTATTGHTSVDVHSWNLSSLTITPTNDADFSLTFAATETNGQSTSATTTAHETVTVDPLAPTVAWSSPSITGVAGSAFALGTLSDHVNSLTGDTNSLKSLVITGAPVGAVLSDGHGHSATITTTTQQVSVSNWSLSSLEIKTVGETPFTLTATATEKDAQGNTSVATAAEAVTFGGPSIAITTFDGNAVSNPANDVLNATEAQSNLIIGGSSTEAVGQTVTVTLNGVQYTSGPVAANGSWSVTVPSANLASASLPDGPYTVTADVKDQYGNPATEASQSLAVHETLPTIAITTFDGNAVSNPANDVLNATEAQSNLIIGGSSTEAVGQTVTVTLNGVQYTSGPVAANGSWSVTVPSANLASASLPDGPYTVTADVKDQYGNPATEASQSLAVHETLPTIAITTFDGNAVSNPANDVLNATEAQSNLIIGGSSTEAVGQTVTVTLNGVQYASGPVAANGSWSATVGQSAVAALTIGQSYTVTADVADQYGNLAPEASQSLRGRRRQGRALRIVMYGLVQLRGAGTMRGTGTIRRRARPQPCSARQQRHRDDRCGRWRRLQCDHRDGGFGFSDDCGSDLSGRPVHHRHADREQWRNACGE